MSRATSLPRTGAYPSPGFLYNAGNILGLVVGLAVSIAGAHSQVFDAVSAYFAGDPAAVALTVATLIFLLSGRTYTRAWQARDDEKLRLVRRADFLSCFGALLLAVSLAAVAQPLLTLLAVALHCFGKLGSALLSGRVIEEPERQVYRATRWLVLISRGLGAMACIGGLYGGASLATWILATTLIVCYGLWAAADAILLRETS